MLDLPTRTQNMLIRTGGQYGWLSAIALAGFAAIATILGHPFWAKFGSEAHLDLLMFLEHIAIGGGPVLVAGYFRDVQSRRRVSAYG